MQVNAAAVEAAPAADLKSMDWEKTAEALDLKSPLEIMVGGGLFAWRQV